MESSPAGEHSATHPSSWADIGPGVLNVVGVSSALVLVVIAGAWAFVLVPMVRHRHDSASELRNIDRFAGSMRVLSRRRVPVTSTSTRVMVATGPASRPVLSGGRSERPARARVEARVVGRNRVRSAERALLLWRRRALAAALFVFVVSSVVALAVGGSVGLGFAGFGAVVVVCTLGWLRGSARPLPGSVAAPARPRRSLQGRSLQDEAGRVTTEWWHTPVSAAHGAPAAVRERLALRPERVRRPAARVDVAATAAAASVPEGEQSWGVKLLDMSPPTAAAKAGDELFDQTRAAG